MRFIQIYPICYYILAIILITIASFGIALLRRKKKQLIFISPPSLTPKIQSFTNGIKNFDIVEYGDEKILMKSYRAAVFIFDPTKNLEKQIEFFNKTKDFFEIYKPIILTENVDGLANIKLENASFVKPKDIGKIWEISNELLKGESEKEKWK